MLEFIAEEMLESRAAADPPDAPAGVCRITAGATPVVTSPTDSSMQYLYDHLGLGQADVADIHDVSSGLQRLGESTITLSSHGGSHEDHQYGESSSRMLWQTTCIANIAATSCALFCMPTHLDALHQSALSA